MTEQQNSIRSILEKEPTLTFKEFKEKFSEIPCTSNAFHLTRKRLGLTSTTNPKKNEQRVTHKDRLINLLESQPQGLSIQEISTALSIKQTSLYAIICHARKSGFKIKLKDNKYILTSQSNLPVSHTQQHVSQTTSSSLDIPQKLLKDMKLLSDSDKNDFLDMLKKSIFYRISAEGIIQATKVVEQLRQTNLVL
jgi:hypothetical protein